MTQYKYEGIVRDKRLDESIFDAYRKNISSLMLQLNEKEALIQDLRAELSTTKFELTEVEIQLSKLEAKLEEKEKAAKYCGYYESVDNYHESVDDYHESVQEISEAVNAQLAAEGRESARKMLRHLKDVRVEVENIASDILNQGAAIHYYTEAIKDILDDK